MFGKAQRQCYSVATEELFMTLQPIQITMEEITDPEENARFQVRWAQAERNSDWLQAHVPEIYGNYRGKFFVVAGQELFVADTSEEAYARAEAAHPEDNGRMGRYIFPKKMARFYGNIRRPKTRND